MKSLVHLFYAFVAIVPVFINLCICFVSYQWHNRCKLSIARELEQLRKERAGG